MFPQFTQWASNSNAIISVSIGKQRLNTDYPLAGYSIPLEGTGSLQFFYLSSPASGMRGNLLPGSSVPHAFSSGEVRTLAENVFPPGAGGGVYAWGLYCMANVSNLASGASAASGHCYMLTLDNTNSNYTLSIRKSMSGITFNGSNTSVLGSSLGFQWLANVQYSLALAWKVSGTTVTLQAYQGTSAQYWTMSTVLSVVDTTSAYLTTVGEGPWGETTTAGAMQVYMDQTRWAQKP